MGTEPSHHFRSHLPPTPPQSQWLAEIRQGRRGSPNRGRAKICDNEGREPSWGQTWILGLGRHRLATETSRGVVTVKEGGRNEADDDEGAVGSDGDGGDGG